MSGDALRVSVLGPLRLTVRGADCKLGGRKQRAILAQLVVNANRPLSVTALAAAAWEDDQPLDARASIQVIVSNLRKALRDNGIDAQSVLATVGLGYQLNLDAAGSDLQRFRAERNAGLRAATANRFGDAVLHLDHALAEWHGPVLDDLRGLRFADGFAAALEEERLAAVVSRAEANIACGRGSGVVPELLALTQEHPLREPFWELLIKALYLGGRQTEALDAVRRLRETLADELGIDPSQALQKLERRILRQEKLTIEEAAHVAAGNATTIIEHRAAVFTARLRDGSGRSTDIREAGTRIGRMPDNDIVLEQSNVSRYHARIVYNGLHYIVQDLRSSNGVFVGGVRITEPVSLTNGDVIRIGATEFTFEVT